MNWKLIEVKLFSLIQQAVEKVMCSQQEQWVTAKELSERFPIFTADFVKKHGELLPRERMVYEEEGKEVETRFMYPVNTINQLIIKGTFRTASGTAAAALQYRQL